METVSWTAMTFSVVVTAPIEAGSDGQRDQRTRVPAISDLHGRAAMHDGRRRHRDCSWLNIDWRRKRASRRSNGDCRAGTDIRRCRRGRGRCRRGLAGCGWPEHQNNRNPTAQRREAIRIHGRDSVHGGSSARSFPASDAPGHQPAGASKPPARNLRALAAKPPQPATNGRPGERRESRARTRSRLSPTRC